jgi:hypothetical protein
MDEVILLSQNNISPSCSLWDEIGKGIFEVSRPEVPQLWGMLVLWGGELFE